MGPANSNAKAIAVGRAERFSEARRTARECRAPRETRSVPPYANTAS